MSSTDESGAGMADTDINSADPDGTNLPEGSGAAAQGSGDDADRGNLDGSNALDEPRNRSLDQAGGNGSFDDASEQSGDASASDAGESGQDNGLSD
ncbi:hypothetical protein GCM10009868_13050 [Terrabacter aerolatus]|uniref:Uncharacterized protein n=1 Tax=Terrabacter aerolatus TaxID=422442 RepID=A0A512CY75_9MICO|nr:hypothetical protein [Terrabacter aerolatus]GEO29161.1 hypothetical protein TAE01_09710 [Terrabacter aerolatus]